MSHRSTLFSSVRAEILQISHTQRPSAPHLCHVKPERIAVQTSHGQPRCNASCRPLPTGWRSDRWLQPCIGAPPADHHRDASRETTLRHRGISSSSTPYGCRPTSNCPARQTPGTTRRKHLRDLKRTAQSHRPLTLLARASYPARRPRRPRAPDRHDRMSSLILDHSTPTCPDSEFKRQGRNLSQRAYEASIHHPIARLWPPIPRTSPTNILTAPLALNPFDAAHRSRSTVRDTTRRRLRPGRDRCASSSQRHPQVHPRQSSDRKMQRAHG
jgi:hypothetical protein